MSVDTIERVNAYFKANVADTFTVFTIYKNLNENIPEPGSGPFVKLWIEENADDLFTDGGKYQEAGQIFAHVHVEEGDSSLILDEIMDSIKLAFRRLKLQPIGLETGTINVGLIESANRGTVTTEDFSGTIDWRRWDLIINYAKYDCD